MVLEDFHLTHPSFEYRIVASDISTKVLEKAVKAVYDEKCITGITMDLRKRYLLRSKNLENPTVRMAPALRSKVCFKRINLTDSVREIEPDLDAVFCRNVLIYFDRQTQEQVVRKLLSKLRSGGYLFIGHSESIYHMRLPVKQVRPTIFQRL
jgi:chemotaxis protein methyltransferase CheR